MSIYGDFRRVWMERFPESDLPAAWEEDVRSNLLKHRQRAITLREELEKEEFYVSYLEQLLADVEKQKTRAAGDGEAATEDASCRTDSSESGIESSEASRKFSKSCSQNSIDLCISELADSAPLPERNVGSPPSGSERSISVDESVKKPVESHGSLESRPRSQTQPNLSHFVTVIEINGKGKKKQEAPSLVKKFPPKPPPKTFAKPLVEQGRIVPEATSDVTSNLKKVSSPEVQFPEMDPSQLLKEAALTKPSVIGSDGEKSKPESADSSPVPSLSSVERKRNQAVNGGQSNLSKLIDRFSMPDEPPYGRIKRAAPAPEAPTNSSRESPKNDAANLSKNNSLDSRKSALSLEKAVDHATTDDDDDVEYCTLMTPTEEAPPPIKESSLGKKSMRRQDYLADCEPFYDSVPADDSDADCVVEALTLPSLGALRPSVAPSNANYVNIDYFIKQRPTNTQRSSSVESEDEVPTEHEQSEENTSLMAESTSDGTYASNSSLDTSAAKHSELEGDEFQKKIIDSIIQSEVVYIDCLKVLLHYMRALKATLTTSQPVISEDELNTVFYKIPELHEMHSTFLNGLKGPPPYGHHFKSLAENLNDYGAFLHNYGRATDTVKRRSQNSPQFAAITTEIKLKSLQGQVQTLEDLLHKPVARVQKNALVLDDLLKCSNSSVDEEALSEALRLTKVFLDSFNMIETKKMFGHEDRAQRRLVKNSFMVELVEGHRKLRHLFLFNDVMACAKYKASGRDKFTFEVKWYVHLNDLIIHEETGNEPKEFNPPNLLSLKSQACTIRDQILRDEERRRSSNLEKQRKKLADLEAQLVLAYPDLVLRVGQQGNRLFCFLLSSEFERTQWIEAVTALQTISQHSQLPGPKDNAVSMVELQAWVTACRAFLKTNMGSYLLRSGRDESLLHGDLYVRPGQLHGLPHAADLYLVLEVDSYGHYFRKARSKLVCRSSTPKWDQNFVIDLEGSQNLRILLYEEAEERAILRGKSTIKLSHHTQNEVTMTTNMSSGLTLALSWNFSPTEMSVRRVPQVKPAGFGSKLQQVCKREERSVPFLITSCVREVERRGMQELGIYRVSGFASDLTKLRRAFETNSYEAEQLLKEVCVHSVTGILKLYLRELPEALFTDALYEKFLDAWNLGEERRGPALATCFQMLPQHSRETITFLLEHLVKVNQHEGVNKMSMHNLAMVFGPTLLRPSAKDARNRDLLMKGTVDVMAQAGILHHFLLATRADR